MVSGWGGRRGRKNEEVRKEGRKLGNDSCGEKLRRESEEGSWGRKLGDRK
jgi:hypothetical protein